MIGHQEHKTPERLLLADLYPTLPTIPAGFFDKPGAAMAASRSRALFVPLLGSQTGLTPTFIWRHRPPITACHTDSREGGVRAYGNVHRA
jgi:hypothetical protein